MYQLRQISLDKSRYFQVHIFFVCFVALKIVAKITNIYNFLPKFYNAWRVHKDSA